MDLRALGRGFDTGSLVQGLVWDAWHHSSIIEKYLKYIVTIICKSGIYVDLDITNTIVT